MLLRRPNDEKKIQIIIILTFSIWLNTYVNTIQYICHATSAGRKAGRLSTNTAQSVDRLSTNKADLKVLTKNKKHNNKIHKYFLLFEQSFPSYQD